MSVGETETPQGRDVHFALLWSTGETAGQGSGTLPVPP
jgi:hypothetical protein